MTKPKSKKIKLMDVSPTHRESAIVVHQRVISYSPNKIQFRLRIALDGTADLANVYLPQTAVSKQHELYQAMMAEEYHIVEVTFTNLRLYQNQYCIYGYADSFIIV